jgi:hypothetical protein
VKARRALLFLLMVAVGITAVVLLSDPGTAPSAHIDELSGADDGRRVSVRGGGGETQVRFGELDFDVLQSVEVEPGRHEDRVGARVHVLSAQPDSNGDFVATSPRVTLLDTTTGEPRGTLSAQQARFATGASIGGVATLDLARFRAEDWSVHGDVRGEFPLRDGRTAHLACEDLIVHGPVVRGPGRVSWTREGLQLAGTDLLWDRETGRLTYDADSRLSLAPEGGRPGLELEGGALSFTLPPDGAADAGYGELRGGVSGLASDGSRLQAETLIVDRPGGKLTLVGAASVERVTPDGTRLRLAADELNLVQDAAGRLNSADAKGHVRLDETPLAGPPGWMIADSLALRGDQLQAPGRVTLDRAGLVATGDDLAWDRLAGRVDFRANGELAVEAGSGLPLAGLHLLAPGGQSFTLPPDAQDAAAASGELRGPVTGTLPDGSQLETELLVLDGAQRRVQLQGSARLHRVLRGEESDFKAPSIELRAGPDGALSALSAEGGVEATTGAVGAPPLRLLTERVHAEGSLLTAPGWATISREQLLVEGRELSWDRAAGRIELARSVRLRFAQPGGDHGEILAPGGFWWSAPPEAPDPLLAGHGELRGPVTGHTGSGSSLAAELLRIDGRSSTLLLDGVSQIALAASATHASASLAGRQLELCQHEDGRTLHAPGPAEFSFGTLRGRGTGPLWDERTGQIHFKRDVQAGWPVAGFPDAELAAAGGLDWNLPPGAKDLLHEGRGDARGPVHLRRGELVLDAARLSADGPGRTLRLQGPASAEIAGDGGARITGQQSVELFAAEDGSPRRLDAAGDAQAWFTPTGGGERFHARGDTLTVDRAAHLATVAGHARVERGEGPQLQTVTAESFTAGFDEAQQLQSVKAEGGVEIRARDLLANGESLDWDVGADLAHVTGEGRLSMAGLWMSFASVEVQPQAGRFRIQKVGEVHVGR